MADGGDGGGRVVPFRVVPSEGAGGGEAVVAGLLDALKVAGERPCASGLVLLTGEDGQVWTFLMAPNLLMAIGQLEALKMELWNGASED